MRTEAEPRTAMLCNGCDRERDALRAYCPDCGEATDSYVMFVTGLVVGRAEGLAPVVRLSAGSVIA